MCHVAGLARYLPPLPNGLDTMAFKRSDIIRAGLETLYYSGVYRAFENNWSGMGAVFMLHHIRAQNEPFPGFHPNSCLETTPQFLDAVLARLQVQGVEFVSMRDAVERIRTGDTSSRFAAFTIDDGYRDNLDQALPIFQKYDCPFTVFIATKIVDGTAVLWWLALEKIVAENTQVCMRIGGADHSYATNTATEKLTAYEEIYWYLRGVSEDEQRRKILNLCSRYGVNLEELCRTEAMSWSQLKQLGAHPLVTIGAHTVNHAALAKLPEDVAEREIVQSKSRLECELDKEVDFFCYPYGDPASAGPREFEMVRKTGMQAAVTTRKGLIYPEHSEHMLALPRVSLNGDYQSLHYIDLYLSGAPFALLNKFQRVDAA